MNLGILVKWLAALVLVAVAAGAGWLTRDTWQGWLSSPSPSASAEDDHDHDDEEGEPDHIRLSSQAQANLKLVVKPVELGTFWRTLSLPGMIVEWPGMSDRSVGTPITGVVQRVAVVPGDIVRPGDELFVLRLTSEHLYSSQTELYKAARELQISREQRRRWQDAFQKGALPEIKLIELEQQEQRLNATLEAHRQDLQARGLTEEQIGEVEQGRFLTHLTIRAPSGESQTLPSGYLVPTADSPEPPSPAQPAAEEFEVEELKIRLGQQVEAGQALCSLADHRFLFIEGRAFKQEAPLLSRAAMEGWPVRAEFLEETDTTWPPLTEPLQVRFLDNTVDPASQTLPFYVPLTNQQREYQTGGKHYHVLRFRPGQRVRLDVPVEQFHDVIVLPAAAVVREGPEAYVFRQNGDLFERRPVQVRYQDRRHVVLADDGSLAPGIHVAQNAAAELNRALKAEAAGGDHGHHHDHEH